jgi:hypothetical protein
LGRVAADQKRARIFGVLYLITFVTSIPALLLYQPVLDHPVGYIAGAGQNNQVLLGAFLELLLIIANIGTAVVIFPIVRRQSEGSSRCSKKLRARLKGRPHTRSRRSRTGRSSSARAGSSVGATG